MTISHRFPVEAGHILMFARALGDPNPIYYGGKDHVEDRSHVIAPPTFVEASLHYDDEFPYRPRIGQPWFGSAAEPSGAPAPASPVGSTVTSGTSFHAETHLEYFEPLRPGDILEVVERPGDTWERDGVRGGHLWLSSRVVDFQKVAPGTSPKVVVRRTTVGVTTERRIAPQAGPASLPGKDHTPPALKVEYSTSRIRSGDVEIGDRRESLVVSNLTRGQILLYAGASGDFSPQHTDEVWNTRVGGYRTIFAHGMLTMGMTARVLTDWFGVTSIRRMGLRFREQVWPGDTLLAQAEVVSKEQHDQFGRYELELSTRNARGATVVSGYATVELDN